MDIVNINAYAKVNLSIDIVGRRDDGYHLVDMIMQEIPFYDKITVFKSGAARFLYPDIVSEINESVAKHKEKERFFKNNNPDYEPDTDSQIFISCTNPKVPVGKKNLVCKAARVMLDEAKCSDKISIHIKKRVPVGGGLGGGSSDCAAVIKALNKLLSLNYPDEKLCEIAGRFGSDVPFFIKGGACRVTGIGTELKQIPMLRRGSMLIVNPNIFLSTEKVYTYFDSVNVPEDAHPDTAVLLKHIENNDLYALAKNMKNVLEFSSFDISPEIKRLKMDVLSSGAVGALMSGSGSTVFGIYSSPDALAKAVRTFRGMGYFAVGLDTLYVQR